MFAWKVNKWQHGKTKSGISCKELIILPSERPVLELLVVIAIKNCREL